jgi:thioredoxin-like negative regulator of GroEL
MEAETLFIKFAQKCDDKEYLIKKIRELIYLDGSDVGYTFVSCIKKMLNKEQIRKLISLLTEKLPNQEYVNYSIIADIAKELPDGDLYEKTSKKARNLTVSYLDIAKVYYEEGKYDKALEKVNLYKADYSFQELNKIQLLNKIYDKQNKKEEQIKTAKTLYEAHPTIKTLDLLLKASKIESREELINKTIETFYKERNTEYYEDNIKFLLTLDRVDEAETYFFMNIEKIEQLREYYSNDIIDKFEKNKKYLVVTLLYRDLLIKILDNAKYKAYEAGAEYLIQLDILSDKVNNWKHFITHEEFLSAIKIKHSRKKSFWNRYTKNNG